MNKGDAEPREKPRLEGALEGEVEWRDGKERDEYTLYWRGSSDELYWRFCLAWTVPQRATSNQSLQSHSLTLFFLSSFLLTLLISAPVSSPPPLSLSSSLTREVITAQSANQINSHHRGCGRPDTMTFTGKCHFIMAVMSVYLTPSETTPTATHTHSLSRAHTQTRTYDAYTCLDMTTVSDILPLWLVSTWALLEMEPRKTFMKFGSIKLLSSHLH